VLLEENQNELFHKPLPITTRPTTGPASTQESVIPQTQPEADIQLQQALSTLVGSIILNGQHEAPNVPETQPTTAPTTAPVANH
jgi:hypothetical protein